MSVIFKFKFPAPLPKVRSILIQVIVCGCLQIRLALRDWEDIQKFEQDAINAQHFDVVYIYRKLLAEKAFHFTATPVPVRPPTAPIT